MFIRQASLIALLALLPLCDTYGQTRLDIAAIAKEVEILKTEGRSMTMVMWMPEEYWRAAIQSSGGLSAKGTEEFLAAMRPYTMVAVLAADVGAVGAFTYSAPEELRKSVRLEDSTGASYSPIDPQTLNASMKNLLQAIRPMLTNAMGPMGANMELLLFPATNKAGQRIADATKDGFFIVTLNGVAFRYHLPLGSILPPVVDAHSGEVFPGNYHFNPYSGDKLIAAPVPAAAPAAVPAGAAGPETSQP